MNVVVATALIAVWSATLWAFWPRRRWSFRSGKSLDGHPKFFRQP